MGEGQDATLSTKTNQMKQIIEISLPGGSRVLRCRRGKPGAPLPHTIVVEIPVRYVKWNRALWLRSFGAITAQQYSDYETMPKDGKGLLVSQSGKLKAG